MYENPKFVTLLEPQQHDGALAGDIISLKNFRKCDIFLRIGSTVGQAAAVTLHKGSSVSAAATALAFSRYRSSGFRLKYDGASVDTPAAAGETATGAGGAIGYVAQDLGGEVICYAWNGTAFIDNEVLTFSGGKTAVVDGTLFNEDIMVERTASSNTFNITAVGSQTYHIPITADMLGDGYDCLEFNLADANTTDLVAFAILSEPRFEAAVEETAIYD